MLHLLETIAPIPLSGIAAYVLIKFKERRDDRTKEASCSPPS